VNSPALGGKKTAKVPTATPAPHESETRVKWPSNDRGKASGGSYIGGVTKEEDKKKVLENDKKLAAYAEECFQGMRNGFDMQVESANRPHMTRADKPDLVHADYLKQLGVGWQGDFVPEALRQSNEELFKVVQPKSTDQVVPTFKAVPQGGYDPPECETHDGVARIMCLPCMTFASDNRLWGTIQRPDTRKPQERQRKFSAFALLSSVGNFTRALLDQGARSLHVGILWGTERAKAAAKEAILSASQAHAATGSMETDWLGFNTPLAADASLHFRLRCKVCQTDVPGDCALGVDDAIRELKAHLANGSHSKNRTQSQTKMDLYARKFSNEADPMEVEEMGSGEDEDAMDEDAVDEDAEKK
jgi:hypothetical protein